MLSNRNENDEERDINEENLQKIVDGNYKENGFSERIIFFDHIKNGNMPEILKFYEKYRGYLPELINKPLHPYFPRFYNNWLWSKDTCEEIKASWEISARKVAKIYAEQHPYPFPLQQAILCDQFEVALSLLNHGADLTYDTLDYFDPYEESVLFLLVDKPKSALGEEIFFRTIMRVKDINPKKKSDNNNHATLLSCLTTQLTKKSAQDTYIPELLVHAMMEDNVEVVEEILQLKLKVNNYYRIVVAYVKWLEEYLKKKYVNYDSYYQREKTNAERKKYYNNFIKHLESLNIPNAQKVSIRAFLNHEYSLVDKYPDSNTTLDVLLKTWSILLYGETNSYLDVDLQNVSAVDQQDVAQRNLHTLFRSFLSDGFEQAFFLVYRSYNGGHPNQNPLLPVIAEILLYHAQKEVRIGKEMVVFLSDKQQSIGELLIKTLEKPDFTKLESELFEINRLQYLEVKELKQETEELKEKVAQLSTVMAEQSEMLKKITGLLMGKAVDNQESHLLKFSMLVQPHGEITKEQEAKRVVAHAFKY